MRVGVLGTGRIGRYHARVVGAHPDVEALVVSDVDTARAAEVLLSTALTAGRSSPRIMAFPAAAR